METVYVVELDSTVTELWWSGNPSKIDPSMQWGYPPALWACIQIEMSVHAVYTCRTYPGRTVHSPCDGNLVCILQHSEMSQSYLGNPGCYDNQQSPSHIHSGLWLDQRLLWQHVNRFLIGGKGTMAKDGRFTIGYYCKKNNNYEKISIYGNRINSIVILIRK